MAQLLQRLSPTEHARMMPPQLPHELSCNYHARTKPPWKLTPHLEYRKKINKTTPYTYFSQIFYPPKHALPPPNFGHLYRGSRGINTIHNFILDRYTFTCYSATYGKTNEV